MLKAPFPYFGGKSRIAHIVWSALGSPRVYIEPFFGSGAVLLARIGYDAGVHVEVVNDLDAMLVNAWRGVRGDYREVARWCDWPVNHADLIARKKSVLGQTEYIGRELRSSESWYDAKLAGYWIWAMSCSIGMAWASVDGVPHLTSDSKGILKDGELSNLSLLSERLRCVRVLCGDWKVAYSDDLLLVGDVGIFLDPPYGSVDRCTSVYTHDSTGVALEVEDFGLRVGGRSGVRIVVAGYDGEYPRLMDAGWRAVSWVAAGGYGNQGSKDSQGKINRFRERLFLSPGCHGVR